MLTGMQEALGLTSTKEPAWHIPVILAWHTPEMPAWHTPEMPVLEGERLGFGSSSAT